MQKLINSFHAVTGRIASRMHAFARDEEGATMIEYALIAALISVVAIVVLQLIGTNLTAVFQSVADALQ